MRRSLIVLAFLLGVVGSGCSGCDSDSAIQPDAAPTPDAGPGVTEVVCEELPAVSSGTCEVTPGGNAKLLKGIVLTPTTVYRGGQVAVDAAGQITCVGCDCEDGGETVISCPDGAISPGLINTHDHITFTQNPPYTDSGVRYEHRHQWRIGQDTKPKIRSENNASDDQVRWGELRFLMGGATSIVGSGGKAGLLRNLDSALQEGLGQKPVDFDTFPLDDTNGTRRTDSCNYGTGATTATHVAALDSYEPHTAEGIDASARNEFLCQSSTTYDTMTPGVSQNLLLPQTAMIHAIGLQPTDLSAMAAAGTGLIWSPRSNITLYGDTARVTTAARLGVEIALGTDWMPTGSMNLLRELRCADSLNTTYYGKHFTDAQLWQMVTLNAAAVTATDDVIGLLAEGKVADISIFAAHGKTFRAVIDAEPQDVVLVMRGGKVLYGDDGAVSALAQDCDTVDVCGTGKRVCLMSELGKTYAALQSDAGATIYPAFTCGPPPNEPSCTPTRPTGVAGSSVYTGIPTATDGDGDGLDNAADKCPTVFDPIRPIDNGLAADADGDGVGDACDPCPLDANTTTCTVVDPDDRDHDGVPNSTDNCPDLANADQADADGDGKGDVCDACAEANPGNAGCPTTIYKIKNGTEAVGSVVRVTNALVTGKGSNGFFVQIKDGDAGYAGVDFSGMFVYTGANAPTLANATVGARVRVDGRVANFQGELELDTVSDVTVTAAGPEALPAPVSATYAEVKTGGTRAMALESVIVELPAATVSAVNATQVEFTLSAGSDTLVVDDFLFVPTPAPTVGQTFTTARGILAHRSIGGGMSASRLLPRSAADLVAGAPGLASFGPALGFARVGDTIDEPTFPAALTVTLAGPAQGDTVVTVTSNSAALTVANVTVANGATSAVVPVTAVAQNADVTLTATLGAQSLTAHVRILGAAEVPTTVTMSPATATVAPNGTVTLTVTLDVPAPNGGTSIGLAVNPMNAGTTNPASAVVVDADTLTKTLTYTDAAGSGMATVTASLNASTSTTTIKVTTAPNHLVISQVYAGGGNTGAPYTHDFIEIFNPTAAAVSLQGLSVQWTSANGTSWAATNLPNISVPAGGYALIQEAMGSGNGAALPTPDATGTFMMGAASGKVALVSSTTLLTGACPTAGVIDFVGYGTTNCFEGTAGTPAPSNTTAAIRATAGCTDTDNNATDFTAAAPTPRNSATTPAPCN